MHPLFLLSILSLGAEAGSLPHTVAARIAELRGPNASVVVGVTGPDAMAFADTLRHETHRSQVPIHVLSDRGDPATALETLLTPGRDCGLLVTLHGPATVGLRPMGTCAPPVVALPDPVATTTVQVPPVDSQVPESGPVPEGGPVPLIEDAVPSLPSRNLIAPTAIPMPAGTGVASLVEGLGTVVAYGASPHVAVWAGTIPLSALFSFPMGAAGIRFSSRLDGPVHAGFGFSAALAPDVLVTCPYVALTLGEPSTHTTLTIGDMAFRMDGDRQDSIVPVSLSVSHSGTQNVGLLGEVWGLVDEGRLHDVIVLAALRVVFLEGSCVVDAGSGLFGAGGEILPYPIPWATVSWIFGTEP